MRNKNVMQFLLLGNSEIEHFQRYCHETSTGNATSCHLHVHEFLSRSFEVKVIGATTEISVKYRISVTVWSGEMIHSSNCSA